jgi:hypothetical protein
VVAMRCGQDVAAIAYISHSPAKSFMVAHCPPKEWRSRKTLFLLNENLLCKI